MIPIIIGANGITGTKQIEYLLTLQNVSNIVGVSRKLPNAKWLASLPADQRERLTWVSVDFLKDGGEQEAVIKLRQNEFAQKATHFMYMAYIDGVEKMNEMNVLIFERSLRAVDAVAGSTLDFVLLQIGLGVYGGAASPQPWREDRCAGPNPRWNKFFYVGQMDFLKGPFSKGKRWENNWTITAPSLIFGSTTGAYMNMSSSLAIYASIKAVLGEPLMFTGTKESFEEWQDGTDVGLLVKFNVWAMQEERCKTEMFNIVNGDVFSWASVWPLLAQEFGAKIPDNMFADVPATAKKHNYRKYSIEKEMKSPFPTASSSTTKAEYAWKLLCAQDKNLDPEAWKYATWDFVDQVLIFGSLASMTKAKKLGWTGWLDTEEMFRDQWKTMRQQGIVPTVKIQAVADRSKI